MGWTPRTLQGQLTVFFLILTLVPVLVVTVIATRELFSVLSQWQTPGVQQALDGSVALAQELMERTRNDLRQRGQLLAADPVMGVSPAQLEAEGISRRMATTYNLDFVQVYSPSGELILEVTRDPQFVPPVGALPGIPDIAAKPEPFLENTTPDLLAYAGYAGSPGESEWILVAGIYLDEEFYDRRESLTRGVAFYRTLPTVISLRQKVVLLTLGGLLVVLGLGTMLIARRLAARVSRPVQSLGEGMERVTHGDDGVRVAPHGTEEMERLIETFNTMSTELSRSRRELARAERLSAWRDVARRVAHEMKNALTPVTFSAHRIRKLAGGLDAPDRERLIASLDTVIEEVEGLNRMAASFSELARMPVPDLDAIDLAEVVRKTAAAFTDLGERLSVSVPEGEVTVNGDRTLLRQALANLVKNAAEAAPEGRVWVRLDAGAGRAQVIVEDDGPGWPGEDRERSLEPYVTTKEQGTGLGLSLVNRTLLQHGGSLELGDRPGGGARVTLVLPLAVKSGTGPAGDDGSRGKRTRS